MLGKSTRVGKYEILSLLGQGPRGLVYKACDSKIGRLAVLKTFTCFSGEPLLLQRFLIEINPGWILQHANIEVIYDLGQEGETPFIGKEYLVGQTMEQVIAEQRLWPLAQKVGCMVQICSGLSYAHKCGVIHRFIKPSNIIFTTEGAAKIVDFSMQWASAGKLKGATYYLSPQQIKGERADERSDIWTLGELFYKFLSYQRAFNGETMAELMENILCKDPKPIRELVSDVPIDLEEVLKKMLRKEISERYQSVEAVLHDLEPIPDPCESPRVCS
jgi:eukaryotic-like serine/threonine-protein kinase